MRSYPSSDDACHAGIEQSSSGCRWSFQGLSRDPPLIKIGAMTSRFVLLLGLFVSMLAFQPHYAFAQEDAADALKQAVAASTRRPEYAAGDHFPRTDDTKIV
jgi:hypothetical protein